MSTVRYAVYFAPAPDDPWWAFGSGWIGRCAVTGRPLDPPRIEGIDAAQFARLTASPRRYGFHATLRAPFRPAPGVSARTLCEALERLLMTTQDFELPPLHVALIDDFLALVPAAADARIEAIAATCVTGTDALRAPLEAAELARRRAGGLDAREEALLQRWGYPWVLDLFRFHLSLTGPLGDAGAALVTRLAEGARALTPAQPPRFDAVCVFEEPGPGADFRLVERIRFAA
jgi:putative phosphonate metabolism protein